MFNEKNIPTLIILTPIFSIILLVSILLYYLVNNQQNNFKKESAQLEKEYISKQKEILKKETNGVISYIKYQKNLLIENTKKSIHIQMSTFAKNIEDNTISYKNYYNYIKQSATSNTDFIIFDIKNKNLIKNPDVFFNFDNINELKKILKNKKEAYLIEDGINLYLFKYLKNKNLILVLKKDIFYLLDDLKYNIARWVEFVRYGNNNYFWVYTNTNILIAHGKRKKDVGKDETNRKDPKNNLYVQNLIRLATKHHDGDFLEFFDTEKNGKVSKKIAFVKLYSQWNWVIGSGIFLDEIHNVILNKKKDLEKKTNHYIQTAIVIAFLLIIFISILSLMISQEINKTFQQYKYKVRRKELKLKNHNKNLHITVNKALAEAKEKDRAMLHQSRHARMGEMLSMISHQWRQPLNQLSGILMEIETKIMFKKADNKFILSSSEDATNIIEYMSNTIEDFKNFFKPEKDKEEFLISSACENAISLVKESLNNQGIKLYYKVINDKKIKGYPREYSQVILNLLLNAKDALIMNKRFNSCIYLIVNTYNNRSIVAVKDNAGGIKLDNIEKIFEPYFSTKTVQGTGLGLYMSKMIIEKNMDGKLTVRNTNEGALFRIVV
ncbi:integral membrane sensor signal transduction histidine kinase [Arcobacter nitrofigilis DSM 7299]|uniref:histidine kinase n=1 Tax=Arcobacter nitrofigilis (strain ATCC 33309 / DSM 7299 / CCUG 15893 / LMG 7604 / NCTC 12251 / CI) TaxID=572480 RepID=D5V4P6_ARCNC|nr:cache domain-containing protein [Arcobacter nitrofigilis]ADG92951.1 integral membrane sensor signal transduction histidine kinase [Arcobacter nitrofigilis DSM 7299]